jgi:hypothetical protein
MKYSSYLSFITGFGFLLVILLLGCKSDGETGADVSGEDKLPEAGLPTVATVEIGDITYHSATISGAVIADGGADITCRGFCWDTLPDPTKENNQLDPDKVKGSGEFSSNIEGLKEGTVYYMRAYAGNRVGNAYGDELSFTTESVPAEAPVVVAVDTTTFYDYAVFEEAWDYLYPWGSDHNGSARMYASSTDHSQVSLQDGILTIKATRIYTDEGKSTADPYLAIKYHSGAIHLKKQIKVTDDLPYWEIRGEFQTPSVTGSWPAFWITGAWSWPPESDIMEFKGNDNCWQNTATGPNWQNVKWQSLQTKVINPGEWHQYKVVLRKVSASDVELVYYIDGSGTTVHTADFMNKPFWLIINLQMEGSSGSPGPEEAVMKAKNIYVSATSY